MFKLTKGGAMKVRDGLVAGLLFLCTMDSMRAAARDLSVSHIRLDKEGGIIEIEATHPGDKQTRDQVRHRLLQESRTGIPAATAAMQEHQKEIRDRYETTERVGRVRLIEKTSEDMLRVERFI